MNTARRLLVFGRVPVPGRVKTRLIPTLGADGASRLYERLLRKTLATASAMSDTQVEFWVDCEDTDLERAEAIATEFGVDLQRQPGGNLGERMHHALAAISRPAVLIGTDCPDYGSSYLRTAFAALEHHDAVLGPAEDGGYVLVGLNRPEPWLFQGIRWSTSAVLRQTREKMLKLGWRWRELPTLRDIDEPADLASYPELIPAD